MAKGRRGIDPDSLPKLVDVKNDYNRFDLPFLQKRDGKIFNGEFDVTNTKEKLYGVPTGTEEIRLVDYLVYRPVPKELMKWKDIPAIHPDSLDMERWYEELIDYCIDGVWVDGEYWNPYMVYWLNVFVFPVYKMDADGNTTEDFEPGHPYYCNIDRYLFDLLWKCELTRKDFMLMGGRGIGKNHTSDTRVETFEGEKCFGDLVVGDEIFTQSGTLTKITGIREYEPMDMYTFQFGDGRSINCGTGHLWNVYEYNKSGIQTLEAIDIAERLRYGKPGKEGNRFHIPIADSVDFPEANQLVDPYLLGFLLGDGTVRGNGIRISTEDIEVVDIFKSILGSSYDMVKDPTTCSYRVTYIGEDGKQRYVSKNPFIDQMREIGVWGTDTWTKRIPEQYKRASYEQRLALVQGMMDADGYAHNKRSYAEYYSVNEVLIEDLAWVVRSLGIKCSKRADRRNGELKGFSLTLYTGKPVFRLQRKLDLLKSDEVITKKELTFRYRTPITAVSLDFVDKPSRCIEVDDPSHTYLIDDFIVTHNSFLAGNVMDREYRLLPNSWTVVSSTNEETTNEAWNKIEECLTAIERKHKALKHKRITDSLSMKYSGEIIELPDGTTEDRGYLSKFEKIIYGKNGGKTRGKRPTKQLIEEFAAFPPSTQKGNLRSCIRESRGSWYVGGSIKKCIVMYTGTGGTVENDEAEEIFLNPKAHNILPTYDWPEAGDKGTGAFIPTHIKRSGTWEKTGCPDIALATSEVNEERSAAKHDPESYMGLLQEYPMTIKEVFTRRGANIFNQDKIATQRINIEHGGPDTPRPERGFLNWKHAENGRIIGVEWDTSPMGDIEILEHPHWLSEHATEDEKEPMKNLYVAGADSIDQGTMDSAYATDNKKGSELAMLVKKRVVDKGYFRTTSNIYVAKYVKRSPDVRNDWDNALKLAYYYNAEVNIEYTKIGIVGWFRDKGFYHLLKKRPSINLQSADPSKNSHLIGTTAGGPIIDHQDQKIAAYIDDYYKEIWFPDLLQQLQDYNRDDRTKFDLVIAMGLCELVDEDLMGKAAKPPVAATAGLKLWGYYTDPETGYKKYGVLPEKSQAKEDMEKMMEAEKFKQHGGVRWIDASDPTNPIYNY